MSSPAYYDDGDFSIAQETGPIRYSFPFMAKGDAQTFIASVTYRQAAAYFSRPLLMARFGFNLGTAYLVDFSEPRDVGGGIVEWDGTFASIPANRNEYGSITYTQQTIGSVRLSTPPAYEINEFTSTRDARIFYEYSLNAPLPRKLAPLLIQFQNQIVGLGGWGYFNEGQEILAQDTQSEIYMAKIYQRKSVIVRYSNYITIA